ncbi:MAG: nucleoside-diphosphate sugar epimerase/dehydratase, partial [Acidobacteriota bacterium]
MLFSIDGSIAAVALWLAMLLRFDGQIRQPYLVILPSMLVLIAVSRVTANLLFRIHRWAFLLSGLSDAFRVGLAGLLGTGIFMTLVFFLRVGAAPPTKMGPPRSVVVLEFFISTTAMGLLRFSPRLAGLYIADRQRNRHRGSLRTLIVGAGAAGDMLLRDLRRSNEHSYRVVGFVDDNEEKRGSIVGGRAVLGTMVDLPELVERHHIDAVLIAIPRMSAKRIREILSTCATLKVRFKILPVSFVYLHDRAAASMLQDLTPEDLLPREVVDFANGDDTGFMRQNTALVTGAGGSIGSEICRQLLKAGVRRLEMVDINENELYLLHRRLERSFPDAHISSQLADIRDGARLIHLFASVRPDDVFHAAAHKHVPLMEANPCEAVKNNVLGTMHVARAAEASGCQRFVFISTDKAVRPTSVMGATKRAAEKFVRARARYSSTRYCAVRFGNVLGSSGSVVPIFRDQIAAGGPVTVTHPEVRRYFMTVSEAVGLVLRAAYGDYGELCVLDMGEQIRIVDLARHMITMSGLVPDVDIPIVYTGLRPGEKLYEELLTEEEE